jgi:hypothetical protein
MTNQQERNPVMHVLLSIKQNKLLLLSLVLVLAFAFYWYELRPTMVRNGCADSAVQYARENTRDPNNIVLTDDELETAKGNASQSSIGDMMSNMELDYIDGEVAVTGIKENRINKNKDWLEEAEEIMLSRVEMSARNYRNKVAEDEYEKCMFRKGLEDNI